MGQTIIRKKEAPVRLVSGWGQTRGHKHTRILYYMYIDYVIYVVSACVISKCVNIIVGFNFLRATVVQIKTEKRCSAQTDKKKKNQLQPQDKMTNYDDLMHMYVMAVSL